MSIEIATIEKETWFKITDLDAIRPFFMNVVSDSNHWMFISSNGGLTAGRKNSRYALFPYYTDDKITESAENTGSKSIFNIHHAGSVHVWEPLSDRNMDRFKIGRNVYKNFFGNKIMFEEINHDLGLTFRYQWNSSHQFGFVRKSALINSSSNEYQISVLDGIQNIMPYGVEPDMQVTTSNLADAYKRSELLRDTGLGIYALSAIIADKAEPSEALKANVVWSLGLDNPTYLLSSFQLNAFRKRQPIHEEYDVKGEKGAYFVHTELVLKPNSTRVWKIIANVNQNHAQVIGLNRSLQEDSDLDQLIEQDIAKGSQMLLQLTAGADGLRYSSDTLKDSRHYSNVLFNIMRGGTFDYNYQIDKSDVITYLAKANKDVLYRNQAMLNALPSILKKPDLCNQISKQDDPDLYRLCKEYLPLKFSRRHGDPSRPWNQFSINTHNDLDGSKILDYEGNWRDIFQNWEALVHSYPEFIEGMIFKFLNASTFDGYNPYRVTKDGFDWEVIEHDNPWSHIGYWGDHQIIYLLKFLEFYHSHQPDAFSALFSKDVFVYANVPYRINSYQEIVHDPKNTINFDEQLDATIRENVATYGADAALLGSKVADIHRVNFIEKILATVLAKVSNFIPEAGIWMNTQRPEWNDANNALVGNGVSMVTLCYLRRFLKFFEGIIDGSAVDDIQVSSELVELFSSIARTLEANENLLNGSISNSARKTITDALGEAGSKYRLSVYKNGFSGEKSNISLTQISSFVHTTLRHLDHTIETNRRTDNLYHSYNLIEFSENGISIDHLGEILEGQVAVLSSGYLRAVDAVNVLDALRNSNLYRADQNSYMLYPNKELPRFLEKNNIPPALVRNSQLLEKLIADDNLQIINMDVNGGFHFNGNFKNAGDLKIQLEELKSTDYKALVLKDTDYVLQIFEEIFNHKAFTGRSSTFFAYEGLGSIYWHMVSKLHLAVQEVCLDAIDNGEPEAVVKRLVAHYLEIGEGIGIHKSPELYGAFPTDPYSHTPNHRGAQQPGMTGQVKEDILVSIGELGISVHNGLLSFKPQLLSKKEFTSEAHTIELIDVHQKTHQVILPRQALCFSYCQTPVQYRIAETDSIQITLTDGTEKYIAGLNLDDVTSRLVFGRSGRVVQITVSLREDHLI